MNVEKHSACSQLLRHSPQGLDAEDLNRSLHDTAPPEAPRKTPEQLPRWLSVDQIRKLQRMRKEAVVEAMLCGDLPFEQRGRIRYARLTDVLAWEERRLKPERKTVQGLVHPDLADLA